ncbi:MAG: M36 family metallopeptidase [Nocardioides sp.]
MHTHSRRRRAGFALAATAALTIAGAGAGTSYATGGGNERAAVQHSARASHGRIVRDTYVDVNAKAAPEVTSPAGGRNALARGSESKRAASLPKGAVLDISSTTGTVRFLGNLSGYLTPRSSKSAKSVALGYVRSHLSTLGLVRADLKTLHLGRTYTDITGTRHLFFTQRIKGHSSATNGLTASVTKSGHLLVLGGMPITKGAQAQLPAASSWTITSGAQALARTRGPEVAGADTSDDTAERVVYPTDSGLRPAWKTIVTSSATPATTVIDAVTGRILLRTPLTQYENSTGRAYRFFPGSRRGGHQTTVNFTRKGWLSGRARVLSGNNAHAYSDVNDNNKPSPSEEVHALKGQSWGYRLKPFHLGFAKSFCSNPWPCSWNPNKAYSWKTNRAQNATQVFFYVNNWHDHLKKAPIGFTEAAGNFQLVDRTKLGKKEGKAGDPVRVETDDGANTGTGQLRGLPDIGHIDNANMATPPDGHRPRMQMYLQHQPHTPYPNGDEFSPTNVGDEADTVYHEYTHGLSNRLNVDVHGVSTLGGIQAGAMGEAWSDWYAMDYLVDHHLQRDRKHKVDVRLFVYDGVGVNDDRTEPIDCKVGQKARLCGGGTSGHRGGYTYADYANVAGGAEVHADGEIWAQTLWDLRDRLGSHRTEMLVTRAMELAPYNPSFLDMRNAILMADNAVYHGKHLTAIWRVFAHRGMGFDAGTLYAKDTEPSAGFSMPPKSLQDGTITGTVLDQDSGDPVKGVKISLKFQGAGPVNPTTVTDSDGTYSLRVPAGHYAKLAAKGHGYQGTIPVTVTTAGPNTGDFSLRKDWAGPGTNTKVAGVTGQPYPGCGPDAAIDGSQASGWSSNAGPGTSTDGSRGFGPKSVTIKLGTTLDVTDFAADPSSACGDDETASVANYKIETSPDGTTWTTATTGTFKKADNGVLTETHMMGGTVTGVNYVKFTIESNQTTLNPADYKAFCANGGGVSGCHYTDLSELAVYGKPST